MEPVRYARCPVCDGGMARVPLSKRSPLVIVDRCPSHGHWCDGGEFALLKSVARSRGVAEALGGAPPEPRAPRVPALPEDDPLLAELKKRPGNWGLVPPEVSRIDALHEQTGGLASFSWGRRRRRYSLLDILWRMLAARR
jgi:hypothetical protein